MPDASLVFLVVFLTSLGLTVVSFALGVGNISPHGIGHLHFGHAQAHLDLPHAGHAPAMPHAGLHGALHDGATGGVSPFNMATILAFFTWFGGAGYLLTGHLSVGVALSIALAATVGLAGAGVVFTFLVRVLIPGQTPYLSPEDYELGGTVGRLSVGIRAGGTGELVYSKAGTRRVVGARSEDGEPIARGTEVAVVRYEGGVAYVETFAELLEDDNERSQS